MLPSAPNQTVDNVGIAVELAEAYPANIAMPGQETGAQQIDPGPHAQDPVTVSAEPEPSLPEMLVLAGQGWSEGTRASV